MPISAAASPSRRRTKSFHLVRQGTDMLSISNLYAGYGNVEVLHGISLEVPKGKVVTLIGSNGAGKTTTMRAICGMIKPRTGTVTMNGKDVTGLDSHKIARAGL